MAAAIPDRYRAHFGTIRYGGNSTSAGSISGNWSRVLDEPPDLLRHLAGRCGERASDQERSARTLSLRGASIFFNTWNRAGHRNPFSVGALVREGHTGHRHPVQRSLDTAGQGPLSAKGCVLIPATEVRSAGSSAADRQRWSVRKAASKPSQPDTSRPPK